MKLLNEMNEIALVRTSSMSIISKKRQNANYKAKQYRRPLGGPKQEA